jgi:hypothetical protein
MIWRVIFHVPSVNITVRFSQLFPFLISYDSENAVFAYFSILLLRLHAFIPYLPFFCYFLFL